MNIAILFGGEDVKGIFDVVNGKLDSLSACAGQVTGRQFHLPQGGRLDVTLCKYTIKRGKHTTICNVFSEKNPFSFNLRDVVAKNTIFIPEFQVAVVSGEDVRSYSQVVAELARRGLVSDFARFKNEPETSYASAAAKNRKQYCPTWLGLGRDMRMFRVGFQERFEYWGQIQPCYHSFMQWLPFSETETDHVTASAYQINFEIGQGASCSPKIVRRLEEGIFPILRSTQIEQDIEYDLTIFASLEQNILSENAVRGSEWDACYANTSGNMLTAQERTAMGEKLLSEMRKREQEVICCLRIEARNIGQVPRYAWFKAAHIHGVSLDGLQLPPKESLKFENGFSMLALANKAFAVNRMDAQALPDEEMAILLQPGQTVKFDILIPHSPVEMQRAQALMQLDFDAHLNACREFWRARLASAAKISVPEKTIQENISAGLLDCDLVVLGREPDGPALATIGWYAPIGTESAPIIQFFDSLGRHKLAERCIDFFFCRQRADGFIQNFANYQSETGPLLWTVGEHFRYTRNTAWLQRVWPNVKKAAEYLLQWRERNKLEEYRAKGFYGMIDGKVADPDDFYHSFFLNAGAYLGLQRVLEIALITDKKYADLLKHELPAFRQDIRTGFYHAQARAPVIPLPDGTWAPLMPPWVEYTGGISLYADGGNWFSHGAFASRNCLAGPLWLILAEILEPHEIGSEFMLKTNQYPVTLDNAALSQPYYCRHDYAHIRRGEVSAFLRTYYNQITALQDRETYTFWEHYYQVGQHKTHEQAWFLMQTRWMLWLENNDDLLLLSAVPRAWLDDGKSICLQGVKSHFGELDLKVTSDLQHNRISAEIILQSNRQPARVLLRLPHPKKQIASACSGGIYEPENETVTIAPFTGKAKMELLF